MSQILEKLLEANSAKKANVLVLGRAFDLLFGHMKGELRLSDSQFAPVNANRFEAALNA